MSKPFEVLVKEAKHFYRQKLGVVNGKLKLKTHTLQIHLSQTLLTLNNYLK